ncbi:acetyl-CoA carboxylase biotin carboxylase subunit family protein [Micromonospora sp. NPDC051227]|uniref:acetyl-CoA carboxylase biotin carboxylase subunit family protein n=1 Tax=Micromonospora sp. NPDC051227 TaxID=3364285 RepID=UPI0037AAD9D1
MSSRLPRVAVVYDLGAAVPLDILTDLEGVAEPIFVLPRTDYGRKVAEMLTDIAEVCDVDDVAARRPDGITTFSDFQMDTTARLAQELGLQFHTPLAAATITRKFLQRTALNTCGVGHAATALITNRLSAAQALEKVPLPCVLKPNCGVGGTNTYLIESAKELRCLVDDLLGDRTSNLDDGYVLETRLVPAPVEEPWGGYVSVESMVSGGRVQHLGITGKFSLSPPFRERGGFVPPLPRSVDEEAVYDLTTRALTALGVGDSVCHTEIMLAEDGPQIIEVNGRAGGNIVDLFRRGHGISLVDLAVRLSLGQEPEVASQSVEKVVFHYFGLAPVDACTFSRAAGLDDVRKMPEVERFDVIVRPGSPLDWRRGFHERVYTCRGSVADHDALAEFLQRMEGLLDPTYR